MKVVKGPKQDPQGSGPGGQQTRPKDPDSDTGSECGEGERCQMARVVIDGEGPVVKGTGRCFRPAASKMVLLRPDAAVSDVHDLWDEDQGRYEVPGCAAHLPAYQRRL